ncbi:MAG: hypothetical protein WC306_03335 [Candidatus Paceibacterota bacterium]|jgi:hypothetical protein
MSKFTYVLIGILIVVAALFFYLRSNDSAKYDSLYNQYNHYRDSALTVQNNLQRKADSLAAVKQQIVTKIKYVDVYKEQITNLPDSTIAQKVDSNYIAHTSDSTILKTLPIKTDITNAFIVDKKIAVDYLTSGYLLNSYMQLDTLNRSLIQTKDIQISTLIELERKSNQTVIDFRLYSKELETKVSIYKYGLYGTAAIIVGILLLHK